jgi:hypothetical protein
MIPETGWNPLPARVRLGLAGVAMASVALEITI